MSCLVGRKCETSPGSLLFISGRALDARDPLTPFFTNGTRFQDPVTFVPDPALSSGRLGVDQVTR